MKHFSLFKPFALAGCAMAALLISSCSGTLSPKQASQKLKAAPSATVYSYNDASSPSARNCVEAGPLPARASRALAEWLRLSTPKQFSYAYPQYYITLDNANGTSSKAWGICSDGHGNLVGVLIPKSGDAWNRPFVSEHTVYVCDSPSRKGLSQAVMESLADAGYDDYRIQARKSSGLTQNQYLISKPLSDAAQKKYDLIKQAEEQAQTARAAKSAAANAAINESDNLESDDSSSDDSSFDDLDLDL